MNETRAKFTTPPLAGKVTEPGHDNEDNEHHGDTETLRTTGRIRITLTHKCHTPAVLCVSVSPWCPLGLDGLEEVIQDQ